MSFSQSQSYIDLGVVVLPETLVWDQAIALGKCVRRHVWNLDSYTNAYRKPHVTLFQGRFSKKDQGAVLTAFCSVRPKERFACSMQVGELLFRDNGNVFWPVVPDDRLTALHMAFHRVLHPKTSGLIDQFQAVMDHLDAENPLYEQLRSYGALLAGPHFLPHITIAKLQRPRDAARLRTQCIVRDSLLLPINKVALVQLRSDGSAHQVIFAQQLW